MPTPNYSNSIIYKLCCKDTDITDIYVGSTTNFRGRKNNHKTNCQNEKRKNYNRKVYKFIREHGDFENWEMIMIEEFSCSTKLELHKKEREYFELLKPNLNTNVPNRTQKQYNIDNKDKKKQYRIDNKDKITEYQKQYNIDNKDKITEYKKQYNKQKHECECGGKFILPHKSRHLKTKQHLSFTTIQ